MDWFNDWWDRTKGGAEQLYNDLSELANPVISVAMVPVEKFRATAREWMAQYNELLAIPDSELSPELLAEKNILVNRGDGIRSKIDTLGLGVDTAQSTGLGIVPLIAAGVISVAAALMMYWTYDYMKFKDKVAEYRALRKSGVSHRDALSVLDKIDPSTWSEGLTKTAKYALYGGAGFVAYSFAKKQKWL